MPIAIAVWTMRHRGDWAEYVAMARAMVAHKTTDVRQVDLGWTCDATRLSRCRFKLGLPGFVTPDGNVWGRPVGVAVAKDGSLLVTDDGGDRIWRISAVRAR